MGNHNTNREDRIIGQNIAAYRNSCGMNQEELAEFLKVKRELISLYESGTRQIPISRLTKLSELFGVELTNLIESDSAKVSINQALAFKKDNLKSYDLDSVSEFRKIVKNYLKMIERV